MNLQSKLNKIKQRNILPPAVALLWVAFIFLVLVFSGFKPVTWILLAFAVPVTAFAVYLYKDVILSTVRRVSWVKVLNKGGFFILFTGILVLVNIISSTKYFQLDLTRGKAYSITEESRIVLKELDQDVEILFFRSPMPLNENASHMLKQYARRSSHVTLKEYDPDEQPMIAERYALQPSTYQGSPYYSTIHLRMKDKTETIRPVTSGFMPGYDGQFMETIDLVENFEGKLASAIIRLQEPVRKIYFSAGHGEGDSTDSSERGYARLKSYIVQENYEVDAFYTASASDVPEDCSALIILSPRKRFLTAEIDILKRYLERGGRIMLCFDPGSTAGLNKLLSSWGFWFNDDLIVDAGSPFMGDPFIPFVLKYGSTPVTAEMNGSASFFPIARSLTVTEKPGKQWMTLVESSERSWGEKDKEAEKPSFDKETETGGPLVLGGIMSSGSDSSEARIAAFGDVHFVNNTYVDYYGNLDLFVNTLNYLAGREDSVNIRNRKPGGAMINLSAPVLNFIFYTFVLLVPLAILFWGIIMMWRKRK